MNASLQTILMAGGLTVFALWREGREAEGVITWLTPTEGERAMGLPDGWTAYGCDGRPVSARARQKALGNSIALPCAEYIMAGVKEELEGGKQDSDTGSLRDEPRQIQRGPACL